MTFFGFAGAAAWVEGTGAAVDGEALGAESVPAVGGVAAWGMNGLTRPCVGAGWFAWLGVDAEPVVAGDEFAGICAGGAREVAAAGGLAESADGAVEVVAAGGLAGVCASAPETSRGSAASAPRIQTRNIMQRDPTQEGALHTHPQLVHYAY